MRELRLRFSHDCFANDHVGSAVGYDFGNLVGCRECHAQTNAF